MCGGVCVRCVGGGVRCVCVCVGGWEIFTHAVCSSILSTEYTNVLAIQSSN